MVVKSLSVIFVIFFTIQNSCNAGKLGGYGGGSPVGGAPAPIAAINQLRFKLINSQKLATVQLDNANATIQNSITQAQSSIDSQVLAAQNEVANSAGAPASCTNQANLALSRVNSQSVQSCDQSAQLNAVQAQITQLIALHTEIASIYTLCPFWPPGTQGACVQTFVDDKNTKIDDSNKAISDALAATLADSSSCVSRESEAAQKAIDDVVSSLRQCSGAASA